jgi:hypothetical protein
LLRPDHGLPGARDRDPELAENVRGRRRDRVDEVVVVALRDEVAVLHGHDAVEDAEIARVRLVEDDVTHVVRRALADENEVAAFEVRLHRVPVHDREARRAAELNGPEKPPAAGEKRQRDEEGCELAG